MGFKLAILLACLLVNLTVARNFSPLKGMSSLHWPEFQFFVLCYKPEAEGLVAQI